MIKLPTRYYIVPVDADFRPDPLPPELASTWRLLRAISWINDYRFTPPVSHLDLLALRFRLTAEQLRDEALVLRLKRTLINHLNRLEAAKWLLVESTPGKKNIYRPIVPPLSNQTALWATSPSISQDGKDSSQLVAPADTLETDQPPGVPTSETEFTGPNNSTVVIIGTSVPSFSEKNLSEKETITTIFNKDGEPRTRLLLQQAGIVEPVLSELAVVVPWKTALDWFLWIKYVQPRPRNRGGGDIAAGIAINRLRADHQAVSPSTDTQYSKWFDEFEREATYGPIHGHFGQSIASAVHQSELHQLFYSLYEGCPECGIVALPDTDNEATDLAV